MTRRGTSLVEVLAALLLVSIAMLALLSAQWYAFKTRTGSTRRHTASVLAASTMNNVEATLGTDFAAAVDRARSPSEVKGYDVAVASSYETVTLRRVAVAVYYQDEHGPEQYSLWTRFVSPP